MAAELACAHGLTTGLYTSPHLVSVRERLSICGVDITEEEFAEEYEHLLPYLLLVDSQGEDQVTYFEALTALAYLWFADKPVALGVFEVGMGGTWDATNLVRGDVAVLTPIASTIGLGSTVAQVGGEGGHRQGGRHRDQPSRMTGATRDRQRSCRRELKLEHRDFEIGRLRADGRTGAVIAASTGPTTSVPAMLAARRAEHGGGVAAVSHDRQAADRRHPRGARRRPMAGPAGDRRGIPPCCSTAPTARPARKRSPPRSAILHLGPLHLGSRYRRTRM